MKTNNDSSKTPLQLPEKKEDINTVASKVVDHFQKLLVRTSNKEILKSILEDEDAPYHIRNEVIVGIKEYSKTHNKDILDICYQIVGDQESAIKVCDIIKRAFLYTPRLHDEHLEKEPILMSHVTDIQLTFQKDQLVKILDTEFNTNLLSDLITKFQLSIKSAYAKHLLSKILMARQLELLAKDADKVKIINILISSLKALENYAAYQLEEKWDFSFKEDEMKNTIIPQREKETSSHEIANTSEGRIKTVNMFLEKAFKIHQFETVLEILRAKGSDKDFTLRIVYDHHETKSHFLSVLKSSYIPYSPIPGENLPAHPLPKIEFCYSTEKLDASIKNEIWTRDGAVLTKNGILKQSVYYKKDFNPWAYNKIALSNNGVEQSSLYFEGGNIRTSEKFLFIGYNDIYINILSHKHKKATKHQLEKLLLKEPISKTEFNEEIQKYRDEFGKEIIVVGLEKDSDGNYEPVNKKQECFHIDMCITPLHDNIVMVAEEPENEYFESIAKNLAKEGLTILRCPYRSRKKGNTVSRHLTKISYNNCLIEKYINHEGKEVKNIYLPQYYTSKDELEYYDDNMHPIDPAASINDSKNNFKLDETTTLNLSEMNQQAREAFGSLGYTIIPLFIKTTIIDLEGSLNCLVFEEREY